ncbi:hypothetical protein BDN71DRAFT_1437648 [Pleurotus eryngii]|uniref:Uncharacterized protein n=1 Tax=Pleurotus eryngii TaxID=5323 RepID=A0A9P6A8L5_PLEER|nr:hypothetical protein BDN71DRAFT_1437648 [Pleurotus eryngii]
MRPSTRRTQRTQASNPTEIRIPTSTQFPALNLAVDSSPWGEVSSRRGHGTEVGSPSGSPGDVRSSQDHHDLKQPLSATEASSQPPSPLSTFAKVDNRVDPAPVTAQNVQK